MPRGFQSRRRSHPCHGRGCSADHIYSERFLHAATPRCWSWCSLSPAELASTGYPKVGAVEDSRPREIFCCLYSHHNRPTLAEDQTRFQLELRRGRVQTSNRADAGRECLAMKPPSGRHAAPHMRYEMRNHPYVVSKRPTGYLDLDTKNGTLKSSNLTWAVTAPLPQF